MVQWVRSNGPVGAFEAPSGSNGPVGAFEALSDAAENVLDSMSEAALKAWHMNLVEMLWKV